MPVTIQDVLSLLPEMFPGVQKIPLGLISVNPDNPGPPATEKEVSDLAANIRENGLTNAVKLRPDPANPLVPGAILHPDNPRHKADGTPWRVEDFNYRLIGGETRYKAFQLLQKDTIPGLILNPTEESAVVISRTDNLVRNKGWWADYQDVENLIKANPGLTQQQVASILGLSMESVNWALNLLPLLNDEARRFITRELRQAKDKADGNLRNPNILNKGYSDISQSTACQLALLGPGTVYKRGRRLKNPAEGLDARKLWPYPSIPPETKDLVRRALAVACGDVMTANKAARFVAWIKEGHIPEEYTSQTILPPLKKRTETTEGTPAEVQSQPATKTGQVPAHPVRPPVEAQGQQDPRTVQKALPGVVGNSQKADTHDQSKALAEVVVALKPYWTALYRAYSKQIRLFVIAILALIVLGLADKILSLFTPSQPPSANPVTSVPTPIQSVQAAPTGQQTPTAELTPADTATVVPTTDSLSITGPVSHSFSEGTSWNGSEGVSVGGLTSNSAGAVSNPVAPTPEVQATPTATPKHKTKHSAAVSTPASSKDGGGEDKKNGDVMKNISNTVSTVREGVDTADKAKKLLGF